MRLAGVPPPSGRRALLGSSAAVNYTATLVVVAFSPVSAANIQSLLFAASSFEQGVSSSLSRSVGAPVSTTVSETPIVSGGQAWTSPPGPDVVCGPSCQSLHAAQQNLATQEAAYSRALTIRAAAGGGAGAVVCLAGVLVGVRKAAARRRGAAALTAATGGVAARVSAGSFFPVNVAVVPLSDGDYGVGKV